MNYPCNVVMTKLSGKPDSSYPVGSKIEGPAWIKPEVGDCFKLDGYIKTSKNERFSWFSTTEVNQIDEVVGGGVVIHTKNSSWRVYEAPKLNRIHKEGK